jgi:NADPH2:quinone reductase
MDFAQAASFGLTYATSDFALRDRGAVKAGETVLVLGAAGGVGIAAIEISKALGARVIACASTDDKLAVCRQHGADETINYATEDLRDRIKQITGGKGSGRGLRPGRWPVHRAGASLDCVAWATAGGRLCRWREFRRFR